MWWMEIENVPDKVFDRSRDAVTLADRRTLRARSSYLAAVGEGRELMFVLGILPPTVMSEIAYVWMSFIDGTSFTLKQLREVRRIFPSIRATFPYTLLAEVNNKRSERFVRFLGAEKLSVIGDRTIYEWNT